MPWMEYALALAYSIPRAFVSFFSGYNRFERKRKGLAGEILLSEGRDRKEGI